MQVCSNSTRFPTKGEDKASNHRIEQALDRRGANVSRNERDVRPTGGLHSASRHLKDASIHVDPDNLPAWPNQFCHKQCHVAGATSNIENAHARPKPSFDKQASS
jgi:hypothetical protein